MSDLTRYKIPTKSEFQKRQLATQIEVTKLALQPSSKMIDGLIEITELIDMFFNYLEGTMDKKMHQVTKRMETAEKEVKKGKKAEAVKVLKKAATKNEKLVKIDKEVRDPMIKECKKDMKMKGKK